MCLRQDFKTNFCAYQPEVRPLLHHQIIPEWNGHTGQPIVVIDIFDHESTIHRRLVSILKFIGFDLTKLRSCLTPKSHPALHMYSHLKHMFSSTSLAHIWAIPTCKGGIVVGACGRIPCGHF